METPATETPRCIACDADQDHQPLLAFAYRGRTYWICPGHLPILIHDPARLSAALPGADTLKPSPHEH